MPEFVYKLPLTPVFGINIPEGTSLGSIRIGEPTPLRNLYQQDEASGEPNLNIFTAKTEEIEVKQILAQIKMARASLDESVVYFTNSDTYKTLFYHLSQKMDIPITYGDGLPVSFSIPGQLVSGLLEWIQSNYSVQVFLELFNEGLIELGKNIQLVESGFVGIDKVVVSKTKIAKVLRELKIGWSKDRYLSLLNMEFNRLGERFMFDNKNEFLETRIKEILWIRVSFSAIFENLPTVESTMNYKKCLTGIAYILKNNCKTSSALDEIAKTTLLEEIEKILPYADESLSSNDVIEKVKDLLLSVRINQSRPKPGHLHVSSYKTGIYNSRTNVFIVGMDNKKFPGNSSEDHSY
ncbi:MAG: hypothetical protein K6T88_10675 [Bacillus sp. (in: Bacteria)]|nr:hypothetical protein [Bacillus sp. (in: firmicutes)]